MAEKQQPNDALPAPKVSNLDDKLAEYSAMLRWYLRFRELALHGGGLGDNEAMERDGTTINGNGADSLPIFHSFTGDRGRDTAHVKLEEVSISIATLLQKGPQISGDGAEFTSKASASTQSDTKETLKHLISQLDEAFVHQIMQSVMRSLLEEYARLLDRNKAIGDVAVAGADSAHPDMLEKMEKILTPLLSFSLPLCATAYPIVKDLPETERHLAYGLIGSVPAILFLGLLPTLFTKSPKAGTFAMSAMLLASGIVIGLFTWAWCSLNPSLEYVIPMGVAGALLLCATIILMVAFFLCRKRVQGSKQVG